jgi:uncharacterized Rossmann fold enzyme
MDKLDELLKKHNEYESYLIELIDSIQELSDESFEERVKREDEIISLKAEVESEKQTTYCSNPIATEDTCNVLAEKKTCIGCKYLTKF